MSTWQERARDALEAQWREEQRRREEAERQREAQRRHAAEQRRQQMDQALAQVSTYLRQWLRDTLGVTCEVSGPEVVVDGVRFAARMSGNAIQVVMIRPCPHCHEVEIASSPLQDLAHVGELLREFRGHHSFCPGRPMTEGEWADYQRRNPYRREGPWG